MSADPFGPVAPKRIGYHETILDSTSALPESTQAVYPRRSESLSAWQAQTLYDRMAAAVQ